MARIPGAEGLGQVTAPPTQLSNVQIPRDAFGGAAGRALEGVGNAMAQEEAQRQRAQLEAQREQEREIKQAMAERKAANAANARAAQQNGFDELDGIADEVATGIKTRQINKEKAGEEWQRLTSERLAERLKDVPEEHRATVQQQWNIRASRLNRSKIIAGVRERDREDVRSGIDQTLEHAQRLYAKDPQAATELVNGTLEAMGPFSGYGADEIAKKRQTFIEGAEYTAAATLIDNARGDPKKLDEAAKAVDNFANLDPERKRALKDKAFDQKLRIEENQARKAEAAARQYEAGLKRAESAFQAAQALSDKGILTDAQRDVYAKQMTGTPFAASFRTLMENQAVTGALAMQPPGKVQAEIDALRTDINKNGISEAKQKRLQQLENVQRGQQTDIKADPLRAFTDRYATAAIPPVSTASVPEFVQSMAARVNLAAQASGWAGEDAAPLFKEEVAGVRKLLETLPENSRGEAVAMIAKNLGRSASRGLAKQLDPKDEALRLSFLAAAGGTPEGARNAQAILKGSKALQDKTVFKDDVAVSGWGATIAKELEGVITNPSQREQVAQAAYYITAATAADNRGTAGGSDIRRAVQSALGGEIVEQGQGRIVIPQGMTHSDLTRRLKSMTPADLMPQTANGMVRAGGQEIPVAELVSRLPGATLATAAPGQYFVMVPRVMGGKPDSPVVNPQTGKPIIVSAQ